MGKRIFDQYSILHFAVGIVAYFFGIKFSTWFVLHLIFEILENTQSGMAFINKYLTIWPGGKNFPDSIINSFIGDQFAAIIGWYVAYQIDIIGKKYGWATS